jgi:hypothetical protein
LAPGLIDDDIVRSRRIFEDDFCHRNLPCKKNLTQPAGALS